MHVARKGGKTGTKGVYHRFYSVYLFLGMMVGMMLKMGKRLRKEMVMTYSSPSISGVGKAGVLFRKKEAFP